MAISYKKEEQVKLANCNKLLALAWIKQYYEN